MALFNSSAGMYLRLFLFGYLVLYDMLEMVFKSCNYVFRTDAEEALQGLNGSVIGKQAVRLSWGRSPSHKQVRPCFTSLFSVLYYLCYWISKPVAVWHKCCI